MAYHIYGGNCGGQLKILIKSYNPIYAKSRRPVDLTVYNTNSHLIVWNPLILSSRRCINRRSELFASRLPAGSALTDPLTCQRRNPPTREVQETGMPTLITSSQQMPRGSNGSYTQNPAIQRLVSTFCHVNCKYSKVMTATVIGTKRRGRIEFEDLPDPVIGEGVAQNGPCRSARPRGHSRLQCPRRIHTNAYKIIEVSMVNCTVLPRRKRQICACFITPPQRHGSRRTCNFHCFFKTNPN